MTTFGDKMRLLKGLCGAGEKAFNGPFYATVDITRRCNLRCIGCRYHSLEGAVHSGRDFGVEDISFDLYERFCKELSRMGTGEIILIGEGEPLIHPRIFDMIDLAKEKGMRVILLTNGTLLDDAKCRDIIKTGLDILKVSLWGSTPDEYEKNYPGTPTKYFERTVAGLKAMSALKRELNSALPAVYLHHPINRHNFQGLDRMVDLAHEVKCDFLSFSPLKPNKGEEQSPSALSAEEEDVLKRSLAAISDRLDSFSIANNIDHTLARYELGREVWRKLPCYIGWFHCRIRVDGTIFACATCDMCLGNLNENSFQDIWNGPAYKAFRRTAITREGLTGLTKKLCECGYCCHVGENERVHSLFKWFAPLFNRSRTGLKMNE